MKRVVVLWGLFVAVTAVRAAGGLSGGVSGGTTYGGAAPIMIDGGSISCAFAGANTSGCMQNVGGVLNIDAGITITRPLGEVAIQTVTGAKICTGTSALGCLIYQTSPGASIQPSVGLYSTLGVSTLVGAAPASDRVTSTLMCTDSSCTNYWSVAGGINTAKGIFSTSITAGVATAGGYVLSNGTATKTVVAGVHCVCGLEVGTVWPKCAVSSTTLTITGTGTDTGNYICL